jgi:hypothetical protein
MDLLLLTKGTEKKREWKFEIDIKKYGLAIQTSGRNCKRTLQRIWDDTQF